MNQKTWEWERTVASQKFIVSNARELMPTSFVQEAFGTKAMFWTDSLSDETTRAILDNSLTLGVYKLSDCGQRVPIGMSRMITDYTTIAFLTDVYIADAYRSFGLGKWMIHCCREVVLEMKNLRFMILFTGEKSLQKFYSDQLGMEVVSSGPESSLTCMRARSKNLADAAAASQQTTDGPGTTHS